VDRYDPGYEGEKLFYPRYTSADFYTERERRHMRALYAAEVTMVDHWLGYLLGCLDAMDLSQETVVIFLSDHGIFLGERGLVGKAGRRHTALLGWPLYHEVTAVPFMIRLPGVSPGRCGALVHPGDLMPTILDLAGAPRPSRVQAASLLPLLLGDAGRVRDCGVSSWGLKGWSAYRPSTVWTDEWSLVYWRAGIEPELYHLPTDPGQRQNVYREHRGAAREVHRQYVDLLQRLDTPVANYWPRRMLWRVPWAAGPSSDLFAACSTARAG
jgi:arylsulfatase A-like enzyme